MKKKQIFYLDFEFEIKDHKVSVEIDSHTKILKMKENHKINDESKDEDGVISSFFTRNNTTN